MSSLVILAASVFEISSEKKTNKQRNSGENATHATAVGVAAWVVKAVKCKLSQTGRH